MALSVTGFGEKLGKCTLEAIYGVTRIECLLKTLFLLQQALHSSRPMHMPYLVNLPSIGECLRT
jgi:hypothetical protein